MSFHPLQAVNRAQIAKKPAENAGKSPRLRKACWKMNLITSPGVSAFPREAANQQVSSYHMTAEAKGRQTLNVVLPTMGNEKSFLQHFDINLLTPCITLLGLKSDNKCII